MKAPWNSQILNVKITKNHAIIVKPKKSLHTSIRRLIWALIWRYTWSILTRALTWRYTWSILTRALTWRYTWSILTRALTWRFTWSILTNQRALVFDANKRNRKRYVASCMVQNLLVFSITNNYIRQPRRRGRPKKGTRLHGNRDGIRHTKDFKLQITWQSAIFIKLITSQ